jgi:tape measure domain-containing protein
MATSEGLNIEINADIHEALSNLDRFRNRLRQSLDPQVSSNLNRNILSLGRSIVSSTRAIGQMGTASSTSIRRQLTSDIRDAQVNLDRLRHQLRTSTDPRTVERLTRSILTLGRSVVSSTRSLSRMGDEAQEATRQAKGLENLKTADIFGGINTIANAVTNLANKFNFLGRVAEIALEKIKTGIKDFISAGHEFNKTMEQITIAFETIIGNKKEAAEMLNILQVMAAQTPFTLPELSKTTKQLLIMNMELKAIPWALKNIGDAAAATGLGAVALKRITKALSDMKAKGKVAAQEMSLQLGELGLDAWGILEEKLNKTKAEVMKLARTGKLDVDKTIEMLLEGFGEKFPNLMDKFSRTWDGLMSTIKDNLTQVSAFLQKKFFDKFKTYLAKIADNLVYLVQLLKNTNDPITAIQATLEKAFGKDVMESIMPFIYSLIYLFESAKVIIESLFKSIGPVVIGLMKKIGPYIMYITGTILFLSQAFAELNPFVHILVIAGGLLVGVFIALVPIFATIGTLLAGLIAFISAFGAAILIAIGIMGGLIAMIGLIIGQLVYFGIALYTAWTNSETFRTIVVEQFTILWGHVSSIISSLVEIIKEMANNFLAIFKAVFPILVTITSIAFTGILDVINKFLGVLDGLMQILSGVFTGNWSKVWNGVKVIFGAVFNDIINIGVQAINKIIGLINKFIRKFNRMAAKLPGGKQIFIGRLGYIEEKGNVNVKDTKVKDKTKKTSFLDKLKESFADIKEKIKEIKDFEMPDFKIKGVDYSKPENVFKGMSKEIKDMSKKAGKAMDKVRKKIHDFIQAVQSQADSLINFGGLFERIIAKKFSGEKLIKAIQGQVAHMERWKKSLKDIGERIGTNSALYLKLLSLGPEAGGQIEALSKMTDKKLGEYVGLFEQKRGLSYEMAYKMEAGKELQNITNNQMIINITGNKITEEMDIDRIANQIIQKLKLAGVY